MYLVKESPCWGFYQTINQTRKKTMKLLLTAFCAAMFTTPLAFAEVEGKKCDKKCSKDKQEETLVAEAGEKKCDKKKCDKKKCDKDKEAEKEATLIVKAEKEAALAHCGKCGKCKDCKDGVKCEKCKKHEEDKKEEKKEGTLMAGKKCGKKCDKDKEAEKEATLA